MPQQHGSFSRLLLSFEDVYGTTPSPAAGMVLPILSHTLKRVRPILDQEVVDGVRTAGALVADVERVDGDIVVPLELANLEPWLQAIFGGASGPYTFAAAQPSLTLEDQSAAAGLYLLYNGVRINTWALAFRPRSAFELRLGVMGQKLTVGGASYDSSPTPVVAPYIPVAFSNLALAVNGSPVAGFTEFTLDGGLGLHADTHAFGGNLETQILAGRATLAGSLTALLASNTVFGLLAAPVQLTMTATVGSNSLEINIPSARLEAPTHDLAGPAGRMIATNFTAVDLERDGSLCEITLTLGS